ncbi:MAG: hypothetical protein ACLR4W_15380, partial [Oscillospiraceae bacterium]
AFAAVSDSLGNTPEENQAILEQLSALTGGSSDQVLSMLNALGLLDEDGNFKVDQTITLDGRVLTLAAVMELLENPATDLTRIADVDGTPVALGDLKTMIQIEQELQRIKDTYFSGREFTGEALKNLNSLMEQLELQGISLRYPASTTTAPVGVETVDMRGMMSQTLGKEANNSWESGTFTVYRGKPVGFSYRIQKGQLSEYISDVNVSIGGKSGELQDDGSYKLTYEVDVHSLGGCQITVKVTTKGALYNDTYSYGDLLGMIEFYDAENLVFYDGTSYADHHQLKLIKTVDAPAIKTSMEAPDYEETYKSEGTIQGICIFLCWRMDTMSATAPTMRTSLRSAIPSEFWRAPATRCFPTAPPNFISHTKSTPASSLTGIPAQLPILAIRRMAIIVPHNPMPRSI